MVVGPVRVFLSINSIACKLGVSGVHVSLGAELVICKYILGFDERAQFAGLVSLCTACVCVEHSVNTIVHSLSPRGYATLRSGSSCNLPSILPAAVQLQLQTKLKHRGFFFLFSQFFCREIDFGLLWSREDCKETGWIFFQ